MTEQRPYTIAYFPGAFRPPHAAHDHAVNFLCEQADIDEVVIIVSDRCRPLPGTNQGLEPALAVRVWQLYLAAYPKARVTLAPGSAVSHALSLAQQLPADHRLLFAVGGEDATTGDVRFDGLARQLPSTIHAERLLLPLPPQPVRATTLRQALAHGDRQSFDQGLPARLTATERNLIWRWCQQARRPLSELTAARLPALLQSCGVHVRTVSVAGEQPLEPLFCVTDSEGQQLMVKYAGDSVRGARLEGPLAPKPRRRLRVERRVLRWLRRLNESPLVVPAVYAHDNHRKLLLTHPLLPAQPTLEQRLAQGEFDTVTARRLGAVLARCHWSAQPPAPLWGGRAQDQQHWPAVLMRTIKPLLSAGVVAFGSDPTAATSAALKSALTAIPRRGAAAASRGLFHLNLWARHLRPGKSRCGMLDWELAGTWGDPAFDLGLLIGQYQFWALAHERRSAADACRGALLDAYIEVVQARCAAIQARSDWYAGVALLVSAERHPTVAKRIGIQQLQQLALKLLPRSSTTGDDDLRPARTGYVSAGSQKRPE